MALDKLPDLANLAAAAAVFGQFLREEPFSTIVAAGGMALWAGLMALTSFIARRG